MQIPQMGLVQSTFITSNWEDGNIQQDNTNKGDTSGDSNTREGPPKEKPNVDHIVIPYTQGLVDKKICGKYGIQAHFKGNRTLKQLLVKPKDQDSMDIKSGAIYMYQCGELACNEEYICETSRTLGERYREHLKEPSPIHTHSTQTVNNTTLDNFNITGRENHGLARTIKESIYIRVNNLTLDLNIGKYSLNHIWDRVLLNTPTLK